jgi:hypothetical protein
MEPKESVLAALIVVLVVFTLFVVRCAPPSGGGHKKKKGHHHRRSLSAAGPSGGLEEAQRAAWFETVSNGHNAQYNPEKGGSPGSELVHHFTPAPAINYQDALIDFVANPRMRTQQTNWYNEVAPKSQTAMRVDSLDEAAAMASHAGHGLYAYRFPAPRQNNPLFVTEQDSGSYSPHRTKFRFGD